MITSKFTFLKTYKMNSVFFKTFLILTLLCIIMMSIFNYFAHEIIVKNLEENSKVFNVGILTKTSDAIDLTLSNLAQNMTQCLWNSDIISAMVAPGTNKYERDSNVMRLMGSIRQTMATINKAYLYIPTTGTVYDSQSFIGKLENFYDKNIIENYYNSPPQDFLLTQDDIKTSIQIVDGRIFLFQDFAFHKRIGTLIYEINNAELYKITCGKDNILDPSIGVYDYDSNPLFQNYMNYTLYNKVLLNDNDPLIINDFHMGGSIKSGSSVLFYYQSAMTGWKYYYILDSTSIMPTYNDNIKIILPFLLMFAFIGVGASAYITYSIYKPISNLMLSVVKPSSTQTLTTKYQEIKNEFDFLEFAYSDAMDKNSQLAGVMEGMTPVFLDQLFNNLLSGKELSEQYIAEILGCTGNPFVPDSRYIVLALAQQTQESTPSSVELHLYMISLNNIITEQLNGKCRFYTLIVKEPTITLILSFEKDATAINIKETIISFYTNILSAVQKLPYNVNVGRGQVYNHISDIKYSYAEALDDLNHHMYFGDEGNHFLQYANDQLTESNSSFDPYYYKGLTRHAIQFSSINQKEDALQLASRITKEIAGQSESLEVARQIYELVINEIIEKLISMRMNCNDLLFAGKKILDKDFLPFEAVSQMEQYTFGFFKQAIELINTYYHKSRHKYIEQVKESVAESYTDSSLSLNNISDYVKTNPSYLSKLFKECTGQHFVDYLNGYRIGKAKLLLTATDLTIKEIGFKTGFNSIQSFIRVFKKFAGVTPGQYRDSVN